MIRSADQIPQSLEDAFRIALSGRPGPVLLDIPMNIQRDQVEENIRTIKVDPEEFGDEGILEELFAAIQSAKRPLILAGGGIIVSHSIPLLQEFAETVKVPVVNSLLAVDALPFSHPYRVGLIGSYGNRWANLALGNCDLLLVMGSRLDIRQTGADVKAFQSGRTIFHVDNNSVEINARVKNSRGIVADVHSFLNKALPLAKRIEFPNHVEWENQIQQCHQQWPDIKESAGFPGINPHQFMHDLSQSSSQAAGYVVDVGNHQMWAAQSLELNKGQFFITSGGMGSMGFSLPAVIGASITLNHAPIV
jgi:acetolactate synthase-1/2/3 large subunit